MKYLVTMLAIFSTGFGYSQQYKLDYTENILSIYEFALQNNKAIVAQTKDTLVYAVLDFSEGGALKETSYYTYYPSFDDDRPIGKKLTIWKGLDDYIKSLYPFAPDSRYDKEYPLTDKTVFAITLNKSTLPKAIAYTKRNQQRNKQYLDKMQAEEPFIDVVPNAGFTLNVKKLIINDKIQPLQQLTGGLNYLDSGAVRLSPDCYLTFKVLKTSENGSPSNYMEYKLFVLKDGQATLYVKENRLTIDNGVARLVAVGDSDYTEDEEGVDSVDYEPGENNEAGLIISNDSFDFEIEITFSQP